MGKFSMPELISKQKRREKLTKSEIKYIIDGYVSGSIADYQMSAFLMAMCFTGLDDDSTAYMTQCMAESGDILDLSGISGVVADKHSTGGVGDKTSLVVVPIVAACGGMVAKMSGRGLGFTGGTIDKLESIDGFNVNLPLNTFIDNVNNVGAAIVGQMSNLTPADKKIYALRDVTSTIDCLPLIASSIMSKKIAAGAEAIVLDVKYGSGAFMKNYAEADELAKLMTRIGVLAGKKVKALITSMEQPLGEAVGNSLELIEAINALTDKGPEDLTKLCIELSASMLELSLGKPFDECAEAAYNSIKSGAAFNKFKEIVAAQGGNVHCIDDASAINRAKYIREIKADFEGTIKSMNTEKIGMVSCMLGAGRTALDSVINHAAGLTVNKKLGNSVKRGDVIAVLHTDDKDCLDRAEEEYKNCLEVE